MSRSVRIAAATLGVFALLTVLTIGLTGCGGGPQRVLRQLPGSDQRPTSAGSAASAETARDSIHPLVLGTTVGAPDWLRAEPDGSLVATGYLCGSVDELAPGGRYLVGVVVSQRVDGVLVRHVVPVVVDEATVVTDAGQRTSLTKLLESPGAEPGERVLEARFAPGKSLLFAQNLAYSDIVVDWNDATGSPPDADLFAVPTDAARPAGAGEPWLLLDASHPEAELRGTVTSVGANEFDDGYQGSAQLMVPDRLGGAAIYHVITLFSRSMKPIDDLQLRADETTVQSPDLVVAVGREGDRLILLR